MITKKFSSIILGILITLCGLTTGTLAAGTLTLSASNVMVGDIVTASGISAPNTWVAIKVLDSDGSIVFYDNVKSGVDGTYSCDFKIHEGIAGNLNVITGYGSDVVSSSLIVTQRKSGGNSQPNTGVNIQVNGKSVTVGTSTITKEGDKTINTITVDQQKLEQLLNQASGSTVVTVWVNTETDVVVGELNGHTVKIMEAREAVLEVKTENVTYTLPAAEINIDYVSERLGGRVNLKDIIIAVTVASPPADTLRIVENTANKNKYQVIVKPVEFKITCTSGNKTIEISKFNGYVERTVAIPDGFNPGGITTGLVLNNDGTFSHVPTSIIVINGKYYAKINSLTNSVYSVIFNPKTFRDVEKHWARNDVNDLGARLILTGHTDGSFRPDRDITRAEFAVITVKALGLMRPGTGADTFRDVTKDAWYYDAVSIAHEYGIVTGFGNGKFEPMAKITREQAMTMLARAMKLTKTKVELMKGETDSLLAEFDDSVQSAVWARESIAACVKSGIIVGKSGKKIMPKDEITRAEVTASVRRMLQNSNLI